MGTQCFFDHSVDLTNEHGKVIKITFTSPSIAEHIDNGQMWIQSIIEMVEEALSSHLDGDSQTNPSQADLDSAKDRYLRKHADMVRMREYAHFVKSIEIDSNIIDEPNSILKVLDVLSSDNTLAEQFFTQVLKYINTSTLSMVGIPDYDCPQCGNPQQTNQVNTAFRNIIPLDSIVGFFTLSEQRVMGGRQ
jgi:hypothetical protein